MTTPFLPSPPTYTGPRTHRKGTPTHTGWGDFTSRYTRHLRGTIAPGCTYRVTANPTTTQPVPAWKVWGHMHMDTDQSDALAAEVRLGVDIVVTTEIATEADLTALILPGARALLTCALTLLDNTPQKVTP